MYSETFGCCCPVAPLGRSFAHPSLAHYILKHCRSAREGPVEHGSRQGVMHSMGNGTEMGAAGAYWRPMVLCNWFCVTMMTHVTIVDPCHECIDYGHAKNSQKAAPLCGRDRHACRSSLVPTGINGTPGACYLECYKSSGYSDYGADMDIKSSRSNHLPDSHECRLVSQRR